MRTSHFFKQVKPGFPRSYFFRHDDSKSGVKKGQKFGEKYFYKWWKRACENLGIEGVDLYGGTRHSSAVALRKDFSPEQIKQGTMHQTNKAFERYFRIGADDIREIYEKSSGNKQKKVKVIKIAKSTKIILITTKLSHLYELSDRRRS